MSIRATKRLLWVFTLGCGAAGSACLYWGAIAECDLPLVQRPRSNGPARSAESDSASEPSLDQFAEFWKKRLQPPVDEPAPTVDPPQAAPPPVVAPPPNVAVVGTLVEDQQAFALVAVAEGKVELKRVGDPVGEPGSPEITQITSRGLKLAYMGSEVVIDVRQPEPLLP